MHKNINKKGKNGSCTIKNTKIVNVAVVFGSTKNIQVNYGK